MAEESNSESDDQCGSSFSCHPYHCFDCPFFSGIFVIYEVFVISMRYLYTNVYIVYISFFFTISECSTSLSSDIVSEIVK